MLSGSCHPFFHRVTVPPASLRRNGVSPRETRDRPPACGPLGTHSIPQVCAGWSRIRKLSERPPNPPSECVGVSPARTAQPLILHGSLPALLGSSIKIIL